MEHQLLLSFDDHDTHDPEWIVVFAHHESPVCLACIIQNLEVSRTNTSVQKDFHLSLMRSVLSESQEVSSLLQQHPRVCQHVIDIITECYTDGRHLTSSSEICAQILDTVQSENFYIYFLDKFAFQVKEKTESAQFYVATLEKLALISSAYILILVHIHEPLLKMLLEKWLTVPSFDEAAHCSMTVMLAQLYGEAVLPVVPPYILSTINKYLLNCLLSARSLELQVSTLELLQKVLQCACGPAEDLEDCEKLVLGLKRHLVSRRDTHCIAVAQCLNAVASRPCHNVCLQHVLKSDLPEFLFESLYTINVAQLDAIITCLQSLAQSELFFSRCHAVYGMESILQMVSMTMTTQNNKMLYKALTLLAFIMERQTAGVPLFLSMATQQFAQSMLVKAVRTPYLPVVCAAVRCATTQFTDENLCISAAIASVESVTGDACSNIGAVLMEENPHALLRSLGLSRDELLGRLLAFLCAVTKTVGNTRKKATPTLHDREVLFKIVEQCISVILPVCASNLEQCGEGVAHGLLCFLKTLYMCVGDERRLLHLAESLLTSGFILEILVSRAQWRCHNELDAISTDVLIHTFTFLVMSTSPHLQTLPLCLHHGLKQLLLNKNLQIAPCEPEDAETSLALIMVLYYACLMETQLPPSAQILYVVADVFTRHPGILGLHQLASKFFLFLTAWLREHVDKDIQQIHTFCAELKNLEYEIMEHIIELPVDTWATFHPVVFLWSFDGHQRAEQAGTKILEHWLFHIKEKCKKDNSSSDNYGVFITLFHSEHFRFVLLNLISAMHKDISFLAEQLFMDTLISMPGSSSETKELLSKLYSEVVLHFQHLFMQSLHPDHERVRRLLRVLTTVIQMTCPATVSDTSNIKLFYHVVAYTGDVGATNSAMLEDCFACLLSMVKAMATEQVLAAVPVMVQNMGFFQKLQLSVSSQSKPLSGLALSLLAWMIPNCPPNMSYDSITIGIGVLTTRLAHPGIEGPLPALTLLSKVLDVQGKGVSCPILQVKYTKTLLGDGHLFTSHDSRLLFCLILQHVCSVDQKTRQCAVQCLENLLNFCYNGSTDLGKHLAHHPWKPFLMRSLLIHDNGSGLLQQSLGVISQMWCEDDAADKELTSQLVEALTSMEVNEENEKTLAAILEKVCRGQKDKTLLKMIQSKALLCNNS